VQRAHPLAWFVGGLTLLWYARYGQYEEQAYWQRPWYNKKPGITFADMLATLRLHLWRSAYDEAGEAQRHPLLEWLLSFIPPPPPTRPPPHPPAIPPPYNPDAEGEVYPTSPSSLRALAGNTPFSYFLSPCQKPVGESGYVILPLA